MDVCYSRSWGQRKLRVLVAFGQFKLLCTWSLPSPSTSPYCLPVRLGGENDGKEIGNVLAESRLTSSKDQEPTQRGTNKKWHGECRHCMFYSSPVSSTPRKWTFFYEFLGSCEDKVTVQLISMYFLWKWNVCSLSSPSILLQVIMKFQMHAIRKLSDSA